VDRSQGYIYNVSLKRGIQIKCILGKDTHIIGEQPFDPNPLVYMKH